MHLGWFMTQLFARLGYKLGITELEILTFAFTILTGACYYLWWHKPLNVHCSVPVYLLENENVVSKGILSGSPAANPLSDLAHPGTSCKPIKGLESTQDVASQFSISEESQILQQPLIVSEPDPDPSLQGPNPSNAIALPSHDTQFLITEESQLLEQWSLMVSELDLDPSPQRPNPSNAIAPPSHDTQHHITERSQLLQQPLIFFELNLDPSPRAHNNSTATSHSMFLPHWSIASMRKIHKILMFPVTLIHALIDMVLTHKLDHSVPLCVPTFYSPNLVHDTTLNAAVPVTTCLIRLMPLIAFIVFTMTIIMASVYFPSEETPAWNISAVILFLTWGFFLALGGKILAYSASPTIRKSWFWGVVVPVMAPALVAIFVVNRIAFFIIAYLELGELNSAELKVIEWTSFFPHIRVGR